MDFLLCTHESALSCWLSNSEELFLLANVLLYHTLFTPRKLVSFSGFCLKWIYSICDVKTGLPLCK